MEFLKMITSEIIISAFNFSRGKRIHTQMRVAVRGVRGWLIVHEKERGKVLLIIDGSLVWVHINNVARIDILKKRIKTLCQK